VVPVRWWRRATSTSRRRTWRRHPPSTRRCTARAGRSQRSCCSEDPQHRGGRSPRGDGKKGVSGFTVSTRSTSRSNGTSPSPPRRQSPRRPATPAPPSKVGTIAMPLLSFYPLEKEGTPLPPPPLPLHLCNSTGLVWTRFQDSADPESSIFGRFRALNGLPPPRRPSPYGGCKPDINNRRSCFVLVHVPVPQLAEGGNFSRRRGAQFSRRATRVAFSCGGLRSFPLRLGE
jgi:hypothetical protein